MTYLTLEAAAAALAAGETTSRALTEEALERFETAHTALNLATLIEREAALAAADASDARRAAGTIIGPLDGIPYTLKDIFATEGVVTTAASNILKPWTPPYSATTVKRLDASGAVRLGKVNTDEFTMGSSTETSAFGVTRNPWDHDRVAGGSSGGSAAAAAVGAGYFSIGTDTGGSIRQPAAYCNVTGIKPTYGRVSRWGEIAMASSLDQTGPLARTARDCALVLQVIAGHDAHEATSLPDAVPTYLPGQATLAGLRVGVPQEYFGEGLHPEVRARVDAAIELFRSQGAVISEVTLPSTPYALAVYYIIAPAEVSSNMARYDGIRYGASIERDEPGGAHDLFETYAKTRGAYIGEEVQRRIMLGTHVLSSGYHDAYYKKALAVQQAVKQEFVQAFQDVDVLLTPTTAGLPFGVGEKANDPLAMYLEDVLTVAVNVAGLPGMSVPCGFVDGLPVGMQLIGPHLGEAKLLEVAAAYQARTEHHLSFPNI
jgi:aspartyl-tRNA(Asn)/glutamyl-tRNA(Gln) amidotransferase subunit A